MHCGAWPTTQHASALARRQAWLRCCAPQVCGGVTGVTAQRQGLPGVRHLDGSSGEELGERSHLSAAKKEVQSVVRPTSVLWVLCALTAPRRPTRTHAQAQAQAQTQRQREDTHTQTHTLTHARKQTNKQTNMRTCAHSRIQTHTPARAHTHDSTQARMILHTHAREHTRTRTQAHRHTHLGSCFGFMRPLHMPWMIFVRHDGLNVAADDDRCRRAQLLHELRTHVAGMEHAYARTAAKRWRDYLAVDVPVCLQSGDPWHRSYGLGSRLGRHARCCVKQRRQQLVAFVTCSRRGELPTACAGT